MAAANKLEADNGKYKLINSKANGIVQSKKNDNLISNYAK